MTLSRWGFANYAAGAHALGERLGLPVSVLSSEGNSQKQFADLRAQIARTGGNMVVNIDPNEGPVIAVQGMLANNAAIGRFKGLQKALAENPGVELLQWEAADWDTNRAYEVTKQLLAAHPDVDGIWSANDNMAIGAIAALKETGNAGAVKVSGTDGIPDAFDAIIDGTLSSTEFMDSWYQSQLGLTMALAEKNGDLDPSTTPAEHCAFMISGTQVNARR
ncbi:sugar ABC transporter substrate-binding protein [Pacificibacter marinus]|uniref:sugar ABC transporter substrate-binding protein n=1 Tax=Pacificibacter marinus TaxID=658057 RepID=UPI001C07C4F2|nr:sugar ABC transporter substrate-binding protein [Pacificibacter marinus]MBU2867618.1 sugar ABC transporter substrate-binding protein [Pacificibacter marinus]